MSAWSCTSIRRTITRTICTAPAARPARAPPGRSWRWSIRPRSATWPGCTTRPGSLPPAIRCNPATRPSGRSRRRAFRCRRRRLASRDCPSVPPALRVMAVTLAAVAGAVPHAVVHRAVVPRAAVPHAAVAHATVHPASLAHVTVLPSAVAHAAVPPAMVPRAVAASGIATAHAGHAPNCAKPARARSSGPRRSAGWTRALWRCARPWRRTRPRRWSAPAPCPSRP
jgi:hypothetical protein